MLMLDNPIIYTIIYKTCNYQYSAFLTNSEYNKKKMYIYYTKYILSNTNTLTKSATLQYKMQP